MTWNWQQADWPHFDYDPAALKPLEERFLKQAGALIATCRHLPQADQTQLVVEILRDEALKTSEIEGEYLNRESLQSSIRKELGLQSEATRRIPAAEKGVAEMMVLVYKNSLEPLTEAALFHWHRRLLKGRDLPNIGAYRTSREAMQIISGPIHKPKVHFEAPPATQVPQQMQQFFAWYQQSGDQLPALTRSGITHLWFLAIHPFIDGNGRIARALSEKALAEATGQATLISLAQTIEATRKDYYHALHTTNRQLKIDEWLHYFANTILTAQASSLRKFEWLIIKAKHFQRLAGQLNPRQEKVLARLYREGPDGFKGGLSAENYIALTHTSRATATRDLQDLVKKEALRKTGTLKHTRYWLAVDPSSWE
ncbi:Fic family protein [Coraliomargarita sp. SDUM461004]|uniref:Fic family protein n=1 Tax=Thalassobacterium sedimentorum TaxID=3041258 RepID=A0ABU1ANT2_9BACT|nr:Fic family protein [Coraliomargarita sp. SDUM461004]MDQ8196436.1 Fic family protein [Coraliomargarita sp. SDUM461004]